MKKLFRYLIKSIGVIGLLFAFYMLLIMMPGLAAIVAILVIVYWLYRMAKS